jgi:hypothetical protein
VGRKPLTSNHIAKHRHERKENPESHRPILASAVRPRESRKTVTDIRVCKKLRATSCAQCEVLMRRNGRGSIILALALVSGVSAVHLQEASTPNRKTAQLRYRLVPDFLKLPSNNMYFLEVSGVALNSKGHIFVFQRGAHPLVEFDENGNFVRCMGEGLFSRPHGLRIDSARIFGSPTMVRISCSS